MTFPALKNEDEAEIQSTSRFRVAVTDSDDGRLITIRIDRVSGTGLPLYETMTLDIEEADALQIALMNAIG